MPGFELRFSGVGSDCSTNCATTTALLIQPYIRLTIDCISKQAHVKNLVWREESQHLEKQREQFNQFWKQQVRTGFGV